MIRLFYLSGMNLSGSGKISSSCMKAAEAIPTVLPASMVKPFIVRVSRALRVSLKQTMRTLSDAN